MKIILSFIIKYTRACIAPMIQMLNVVFVFDLLCKPSMWSHWRETTTTFLYKSDRASWLSAISIHITRWWHKKTSCLWTYLLIFNMTYFGWHESFINMLRQLQKSRGQLCRVQSMYVIQQRAVWLKISGPQTQARGPKWRIFEWPAWPCQQQHIRLNPR